MAGRRGLLGRLSDRLTKPVDEIERDELREGATALGTTPIARLADREVASACGAVKCVTLRPRATVPALVVELNDGSQRLQLVWLGRRAIGGIVPGVFLKVRGRVTYLKGVPTIYNPAYEIVPNRGG
ncbi:MAG: OB-fold nucleic acid binding domain-containing protein [Micrococcales bacterium]|nr:OB-fold nucleic acid binding domain-containing protein [Micrococcales bacterium]